MREEHTSQYPWSGVAIRDPDDLACLRAAAWPEPRFAFDPEELLRYLGETDAEVAFLALVKGKRQADVGALLGMGQSSVCARVARVGRKLRYLHALRQLDPEATVAGMAFLPERQREILVDLAFTQHQSGVALRRGVGQSTVRWILVKARRRAAALAGEDPARWRRAHLLCELVFAHLGLRVR